MKLGVRGQLFATSVAVILVALITSGLYLRAELRERLNHTTQRELEVAARASAEALRDFETTDIARLDAMADRLGKASGARITIIASDGRVLGDSELTVPEVAAVENHGTRPEVLEANKAGIGKTSRYSNTLRRRMLYVAVTLPHGGVVRAALPTKELDAATSRLGVLLLAGGLIGIVMAMLMSLLASHLLSSELRQLVVTARSMVRDDTSSARAGTNEIGSIAGTLNQMSEELQQALETLAEERERLQAVLEGMGEAVVSLDYRSRIEFVNARALALLNLDDPPIGSTMLETLRDPAVQEITAAALGGNPAVTEFLLPDGTTRVQATATPKRSGQGCIIVAHDVTEVRRLERVRRDFVSNVSHELRTPVSVMRANAETVLQAHGEDPERTRPFLEAIMRHADRLARIISDLLDLARLEAGRRELTQTDILVHDTVLRAIDVVRESARKKSIEVECEIDAGVRVSADQGALDQILVNFIDNAVKYSPADSHVAVRADTRGDTVRIEVADDGPGIPEEHRARVFERFYRVDPGRSRDVGGTGLGLSICRHLAEAMRGKVGVDANQPAGSVFWVELPRSSAD